MTTVTALVDQAEYAATLAALADANQRIAVLRTDAQRLTGMVDSLMRQRNDLRAEVSDARGRVSYFQAESNQWRARYMAAHDVLLHAEAFIEAPIHGADLHRWNKYTDMRAAFPAYRASIEAGAPLGWAVAEEPATATT